jgi:acyl carrier protein
MFKKQTIHRLKQLLTDELFVGVPEDEIAPDDGLQTVLGLDSVSFLELRMLCEREFQVIVMDDDFTPENFSTLNRLATFIENKTKGAPNV